MSEIPHRDRYESVAESTDDVIKRVERMERHEDWISVPVAEVAISQWTDALRAFSANTTVTERDAAFLTQIRQTYEQTESDFEKKASVLGIGKLNEFEPGAVLFISLVRELQQRHVGHVNMNPHKLRVLLDGRYSVE